MVQPWTILEEWVHISGQRECAAAALQATADNQVHRVKTEIDGDKCHGASMHKMYIQALMGYLCFCHKGKIR